MAGATVLGLLLAPAAQADGWQRGVASAYSSASSNGPQGCTGRPLDDRALTVASLQVPCGARVRICLGSRCVTAVRTDSGPYEPGRDLDLTPAVVHALTGSWDPLVWGVRRVRWKRVTT